MAFHRGGGHIAPSIGQTWIKRYASEYARLIAFVFGIRFAGCRRDFVPLGRATSRFRLLCPECYDSRCVCDSFAGEPRRTMKFSRGRQTRFRVSARTLLRGAMAFSATFSISSLFLSRSFNFYRVVALVLNEATRVR